MGGTRRGCVARGARRVRCRDGREPRRDVGRRARGEPGPLRPVPSRPVPDRRAVGPFAVRGGGLGRARLPRGRRVRARRARAEGLEGPRSAPARPRRRAGVPRRPPARPRVGRGRRRRRPRDDSHRRPDRVLRAARRAQRALGGAGGASGLVVRRSRPVPDVRPADGLARGARGASRGRHVDRRPRPLRGGGPGVGGADARHVPQRARRHGRPARGARSRPAGGPGPDRPPPRPVPVRHRRRPDVGARRVGVPACLRDGATRRSPTTSTPTRHRRKAAGRSPVSISRTTSSSRSTRRTLAGCSASVRPWASSSASRWSS